MSETEQNQQQPDQAVTKEQIQEILKFYTETVDTLISKVQEELDQLHKVHATLMVGYIEITAAMETLMGYSYSKMSPEEQEAFTKVLSDKQKQAMSVLQNSTEQDEN